MIRLCFDYGHGGSDPGALYKERKESIDVLNIGKEIAAELRCYGIIVDETRTDDVTMSLKQRSDFEYKQNYDYFISFHRNAFKPEVAKGVETFVAIKTSAKSKSLAQKIQTSLVNVGFTNRGVKEANFHVLKETKAPAVLIEIGFIDNTGDNELFDRKREEIIKGITKAILSQLGLIYIEETWDRLEESLDVLAKNAIINSPEYWLENARAGKTVKGEYAAILIKRIATILMNTDAGHEEGL